MITFNEWIKKNTGVSVRGKGQEGLRKDIHRAVKPHDLGNGALHDEVDELNPKNGIIMFGKKNPAHAEMSKKAK